MASVYQVHRRFYGLSWWQQVESKSPCALEACATFCPLLLNALRTKCRGVCNIGHATSTEIEIHNQWHQQLQLVLVSMESFCNLRSNKTLYRTQESRLERFLWLNRALPLCLLLFCP